jgi:hypothetical protein
MGRAARRRGSEGFDQRGHRRLRIELGDEPEQLPLAAESGSPEHLRVVLAAEKGRDHEQTGEVDFALAMAPGLPRSPWRERGASTGAAPVRRLGASGNASSAIA